MPFKSVLVGSLLALSLAAQPGGELHFSIRADPKTFNPLLANDDPSETVRYLTSGVLVRVNRRTHVLEPELAIAWKVSENGRKIDFMLRSNLRFSDGTPFTCEDVVSTIKQLMDPALHSPVGDAFRTAPGPIESACTGPSSVMVRFPGPVAALDYQFDQVAILSAHSPKKEGAVLGPFQVSEYKAGNYVLLKSNPNYWKKDDRGNRLPYLTSI